MLLNCFIPFSIQWLTELFVFWSFFLTLFNYYVAFAEVPITETYTFTLSATFETHVLAPVVTVGSLIFF